MILGKFEDNRPVFRGKTKEAITINRKNVTLRGFVIELPGGSTGRAGISVKASGALIDANVFRTQNKALGVEGPAINIDVGSASMRMTNNVVWGFTKGVQITNSTSNEIKIFNNTFVDDAGIPNSGSTIGILCVGAVKASISNNFFSNIKQPLDSSFKGKTTVVLDHNIFTTGKPNLQLLTNSGGLDSNDALATMDLTKQPGLNKELDDGLGGAFNCSAIRECSSLPAASLTTDVKVNLVSDILGKPRGAKKDVGAYEMVIADATVQGRLKVKTTAVENVFSRFLFEVSTSNYDPAESDTLYDWWVSGALKPTLDGTVPASQLKKFPIKQLESGSINDVADGLNENKLYNLYAAFGRTVGGVRSMGYSYRDTIRTSVNVEPGDCTFQISTSACPSADGVFINSGDPWTGKFLTKVSFSNKVETGSVVKNPQFVTLANPNIYNLNLLSPLPEIIFVINVPSLGVAGSTQSFKATIEMSIPADFLSGKELFLLPEDSSSLPIHVSTWSIEQNGAKTLLTIEGIKGGTLHYAFGRLADAAEPGKVEFSGPTVPTFDYSTAGDSTSHISIAIKGSGFKTANPLVLVSMIPAGGMASGILSGTYPLSTLAVSTNLADLTVDQQKDRYFRYYQKAAGNEVTSTMGAGQNKPFLLDTTVTAGGFDSSIVYKNPNLSINGKGELSEAILSIPINKKYKDGSVGRKASRSIEVEFTIFDGSKVSRSRAFIRSKFKDEHLQSADKKEFKERTWNLYGYPWDEGETGNQSRIVGAKKWDPDELRLMKYNGSGTGKSSFTIYDGGSAAAVKFDSARAIWSGSVRPYDPACDSGVSLDYQTFVLPIPAGQWMDISLPFNFSMKMKDILDASGLATSPTIFRFNPSKPPALSWEAIKDTSVLHPWDGLTIKPTSAITLKFPVLDSARSLAAGGPKTAAPNKSNWTARLLAYNSTAAMTLQIGKSSREGVYGEAPDVPGQDFRMVLKRFRPDGSVEGLSEFVQSDEGTWQGHWLLQSLANKGTQSITLKVSDNNQAIPLYLVESLHKTVLPLNGDSIHLSESELKFNDYHVVAGDANYLEGILAGISPANTMSLSNYPNPFSGSTLIRYALPASMGKVVFNLRVTDFRGKTVFEKNIKGFNSLSYLWDGTNGKQSPLPAGVYTLSLETKIAGKSSYKATRRILKM